MKDRLNSLEEFWVSLKKSASPFRIKIQAVRAVAWPRGLHAVASTPIGATVWKNLRSTTVQATLGRKAGVNPFVLLCLVEGGVDPEEVALLASIRDAREFSAEGSMASIVAPLAAGMIELPPNAPSSVLLTRLHRVGIHVGLSGQLVDRFGAFSLHDSFQEVQIRMQWACQQQAAASVIHRPDFFGINLVNDGKNFSRCLWSSKLCIV